MLPLMRKRMAILVKLLETLTLNCSLHKKEEYLDAIFVREFTNCRPKQEFCSNMNQGVRMW